MPDDDYIKRSDALDAIRSDCGFLVGDNLRGTLEALKKIPAADVEPKREIVPWKVAGAFDDFHQCTKCGDMWPVFSTVEWAYCPVCGTRKFPEPPKGGSNGKGE